MKDTDPAVLEPLCPYHEEWPDDPNCSDHKTNYHEAEVETRDGRGEVYWTKETVEDEFCSRCGQSTTPLPEPEPTNESCGKPMWAIPGTEIGATCTGTKGHRGHHGWALKPELEPEIEIGEVIDYNRKLLREIAGLKAQIAEAISYLNFPEVQRAEEINRRLLNMTTAISVPVLAILTRSDK
jgi:hypothetical protein